MSQLARARPPPAPPCGGRRPAAAAAPPRPRALAAPPLRSLDSSAVAAPDVRQQRRRQRLGLLKVAHVQDGHAAGLRARRAGGLVAGVFKGGVAGARRGQRRRSMRQRGTGAGRMLRESEGGIAAGAAVAVQRQHEERKAKAKKSKSRACATVFPLMRSPYGRGRWPSSVASPAGEPMRSSTRDSASSVFIRM